jgi:TBC1 domain family protein 5
MLTSKLSRWIRLLFGREFPFDDLLALWDTLLAEDPALELIDMVCVAMILRIRWDCRLHFPSPDDHSR